MKFLRAWARRNWTEGMARRRARLADGGSHVKKAKKKLSAIGNLFKTDTSESWTFWGGIALNLACKNATLCGGITWAADLVGLDPAVFITTLIGYATGRVVSKMAKA